MSKIFWTGNAMCLLSDDERALVEGSEEDGTDGHDHAQVRAGYVTTDSNGYLYLDGKLLLGNREHASVPGSMAPVPSADERAKDLDAREKAIEDRIARLERAGAGRFDLSDNKPTTPGA